MLSFNQISELKCGLKLGRKLTDPDKKWAEKWIEVKCFDSDNTQIIIKYIIKFWTDIEKRTIEGDKCL